MRACWRSVFAALAGAGWLAGAPEPALFCLAGQCCIARPLEPNWQPTEHLPRTYREPHPPGQSVDPPALDGGRLAKAYPRLHPR